LKRNVLIAGVLLVLTLAFLAEALTHTSKYAAVRPAGTSTLAGTQFYLICDSSDTFQVDTFYSDTVTIDSLTKWINYGFGAAAAPIRADSANDSIVVIVQTYTSYLSGVAKRLIDADTFPLAPGTVDTIALGDSIWSNLNSDTMILYSLWFETIVKDSFIMGAGIDTTTLSFYFEVLQRTCRE